MGRNLRNLLTGTAFALGIAVPVVLAVEATSQPACDRACLLGFTGDYLNAMLAHKPSMLNVASDLKATENGKPTPLGTGLWKTARTVAARESFADPATGEAALFAVVTQDNGQSSRLALRLKINRHRIQEAEALVSPEKADR